MIKEIAIFGAGGYGREIACLINIINRVEHTWNLIGFFDDDVSLRGKQISHFGPYLGGMSELNVWNKPLAVVVAVGSPKAVKSIVERVENPNIAFPNIIHPNFTIIDPETFNIGKGNIIQSGCSVSCDVSIGDFNTFNGTVVFGHDSKVGDFNSFMPDIRVSGEVTVGNCNFFGVGSIILQQIKVGNNVKVGAGSVLMTKPKDGNLYMGVPAKKIDL